MRPVLDRFKHKPQAAKLQRSRPTASGVWASLFSFAAIALVSSSIVVANDGLASSAAIERAGLTVDWYSSAETGATGKLVDWYLNVNENKATTFFTITAGKYRERFSENKISPFGKPYGVEDGAEYAAVRKQIIEAQLKNDGITDVEVKIDRYQLPESTIYMVNSRGLVKALDADTGSERWSTYIGDRNLAGHGVAACDQYVAVVNGSRVYCMEAATGKLLWSHACGFAASDQPAVSEDHVYVPLQNGRLQVFPIDKTKGVGSYQLVSRAESSTRPLVTDKSVSWGNVLGGYNVAARFGGIGRGVSYQLRADGGIAATPVFKDGIFYITCLDGFVYALDEEKGSLAWQVSTGTSISQSPIVLGDSVYAINDADELYKFDIQTGDFSEGWVEPRLGVRRFLGASKSNLYVLNQFSELIVLSSGTGAVTSRVRFGDVDQVLYNTETDRIYVANRGAIQCIRELGREIPYFHFNEDFGPEEVIPQPAVSTDPTEKPKAPADEEDPFKSLDSKDAFDEPVNPFGGNSEDENPFGG